MRLLALLLVLVLVVVVVVVVAGSRSTFACEHRFSSIFQRPVIFLVSCFCILSSFLVMVINSCCTLPFVVYSSVL